MKYEYKTSDIVCSQKIILDIDDNTDIINDCLFVGGCSGNTKGVSSLVRGLSVNDVINKLEGIKCGNKPTSCPDQLANALKEYLNNK